MSWNDFNSADDQSGFDPIPKGTLVKVRMTIKPGGHDNAQQGWTGGWATQNHNMRLGLSQLMNLLCLRVNMPAV